MLRLQVAFKVRLARFVLRRVLIEKSLGDTKDSLEEMI